MAKKRMRKSVISADVHGGWDVPRHERGGEAIPPCEGTGADVGPPRPPCPALPGESDEELDRVLAFYGLTRADVYYWRKMESGALRIITHDARKFTYIE